MIKSSKVGRFKPPI